MKKIEKIKYKIKYFDNKLDLIKNLILNFKGIILINENIINGLNFKFQLFLKNYFEFKNIFKEEFENKNYYQIYINNLIKLLNFIFPEISEFLTLNYNLIIKFQSINLFLKLLFEKIYEYENYLNIQIELLILKLLNNFFNYYN
jgi:hypothetical protein